MKTPPTSSRARCPHPVLLAVSLALLFFGTGCTGVYVSRPLGDRPHVFVPADWEGTWLCGDSASKARVVDAHQGKLELIEAKFSEGKPKLEITEIVITEAGNWLFATLLNPADPARHEWVRLKRNDDQLVVWLPAKDAFRTLVQSGKLKCRLDDKNVVLDPPSAADLAALTSGALGVPFAWDEPVTIRRLVR